MIVSFPLVLSGLMFVCSYPQPWADNKRMNRTKIGNWIVIGFLVIGFGISGYIMYTGVAEATIPAVRTVIIMYHVLANHSVAMPYHGGQLQNLRLFELESRSPSMYFPKHSSWIESDCFYATLSSLFIPVPSKADISVLDWRLREWGV